MSLGTTGLRVALVFFANLMATGVFARDLNFYTFNIRFYGVEASGQQHKGADRDARLREFIGTNMADADVIAFQEIVDVERFQRQVLPGTFACQSYDHNSSGHQHVVLCVRKPLQLLRVDGDTNYSYEEVALDRLRPAVYGIVADGNGKKLSYVVALHLKAQEDHTHTRLQQVEILAKRLGELQFDIPMILTGDFNTFNDDVSLIVDGLSGAKGEFDHVHNTHAYTYRTLQYTSHFDHYFVKGADVRVAPRVLGPCNTELASESDRRRLVDYNNMISDHCPVGVTLGL